MRVKNECDINSLATLNSLQKPCFLPKFGMNFFDRENLTVSATTASSKSSICYHLPDPEFDKAYQRWTTNLVTAVVNAVLSPFAVVTNFLITFVIYRLDYKRLPIYSSAALQLLISWLVCLCSLATSLTD